MEVEIDNNVEVVNGEDIEATVTSEIAVEGEGTEELEITVAKKEFVVTGDDVYMPLYYDDAPEWLKDIINAVTDVAINNRDQNLLNQVQSLLDALEFVPENRYTEAISQLVTKDGILNTKIEALDSTWTDLLTQANAKIGNIEQTYASKTEASAIAAQVVTTSLNDDTTSLGSTIANIQDSYTTLNETIAENQTILMSTLDGVETANATATDTIRTYVGIDEAGAGTNTGLSAYLEGSDGTIGGADSQVANSVVVVNGVPTSKWQYNSAISVNGVNYTSGFGLSNSAGTGVGSEFWIDATKLKFTNSAKTGRSAPFTIDASGTTPQITFNGKVSFTNVDNNPVAGNMTKFSWYASSDTLIDIKDQGWTNYFGSGETYLSPTGLKIGNNSGNDQQWLIYDKSIPLNPNKRYKVTVEAQQTAGTGTAYFGFAGRNYNDTLWVNSSGANNTSSQFYLISSWDIPSTMTTKESNYWSVGGLVNGSDSSIRTDVVYYRPLMLVNYSDKAGTTVVKSFKIEEYEPAVNVDADISANNEVFAKRLGYSNYADMVTAATNGQTIINGGYVNTELVEANSITAGMINASNLVAQNISSPYIEGKTISGGYINGTVIEGAVIRASWIDLSSTSYLSLWKEATNIESSSSIYYAYRNNFAKDEDGVFVKTDNETYYRLPASEHFFYDGTTVTYENTQNVTDSNFYGITVNASNSYKISDANRIIGDTVSCFLEGKANYLGTVPGSEHFSRPGIVLSEFWADGKGTATTSQGRFDFTIGSNTYRFYPKYYRDSRILEVIIKNSSGTTVQTIQTTSPSSSYAMINNDPYVLNLSSYYGTFGGVSFQMEVHYHYRTEEDWESGALYYYRDGIQVKIVAILASVNPVTISNLESADGNALKLGTSYLLLPNNSVDRYWYYQHNILFRNE